MDGVLANFDSQVQGLSESEKEITMSKPHFFLSLKVIDGAKKALNYLIKHYDVYILSTAPWDSILAWTEKRLWVELNLPKYFKKRLILSHHKNLVIGDFLIDDRLKNGSEKFPGELILFGSEKFPNWDKVVQYLKVK